MQLGRKIRDLRLRRGLTVQQLAAASGLSKGFISQVENGRTSPSLATLRDLATALMTSVAYLVVDEAGQVSVANLIGMAPAAQNVVVLPHAVQHALNLLHMQGLSVVAGA